MSLFLGGELPAGIVNTKHNLAYWSPNTYKATAASGESRVCIFCHTPHNASPAVPLWNHPLSAETFSKYSSSTLALLSIAGSQYKTAGIRGASALCMGCHDGVTALGALSNGLNIEMTIDTVPSLDVSLKHPVSFFYDAAVRDAINTFKTYTYVLPSDAGALNNPKVINQWQQAGGWVECTICHDPHNDNDGDPGANPFWIGSSVGGNSAHDSVCLVCHITMGEPTEPAALPW